MGPIQLGHPLQHRSYDGLTSCTVVLSVASVMTAFSVFEMLGAGV